MRNVMRRFPLFVTLSAGLLAIASVPLLFASDRRRQAGAQLWRDRKQNDQFQLEIQMPVNEVQTELLALPHSP